MPAAQNVTLQPSFDGMLAEYLHYAAIWSELTAVSVLREVLCQPDLFGDFINRFESVGLRFIRPEDAEAVHVQPHHFPQEIAESGHIPGQGCAGFFNLDRRSSKIGHIQGLAHKTAVSDRVCAHAPISLGSQGLQLGEQPTCFIKELFGLVTAHPVFKNFQMAWICCDVTYRDLVRPPESFQVVLINLPRRRPSLGAAQDDHRPSRSDRFAGPPRLLLDLADLE